MWPPECQLEGNQPSPPAAAYALTQAAQPAVGFRRHKDAALRHVTLGATRSFFFVALMTFPGGDPTHGSI